MTRKAHELGMSSTVYRNASGLPNDEQVTTARDLTALAGALEERFPRYFRYFSDQSNSSTRARRSATTITSWAGSTASTGSRRATQGLPDSTC